jgi:hypothetical protein
MEDFERQLRQALSRKEQPASFEAHVFAAIAAERSTRRTSWRWEALAASVLLVAGLWAQHEHAAGEAAKARLRLALRVTVTELSKIQNTVRTSTEDE